jgi:hypothetical protein
VGKKKAKNYFTVFVRRANGTGEKITVKGAVMFV